MVLDLSQKNVVADEACLYRLSSQVSSLLSRCRQPSKSNITKTYGPEISGSGRT